MNILVLGGTRFIGQHTVSKLLARGHTLTLLHRGQTNPDGLTHPQLSRIFGDRAELDRLIPDHARYDAVLDTSALLPQHVDLARKVLDTRTSRYVQVGSVSVYESWTVPITESGARYGCTPDEAINPDKSTYCQRKAECERLALGWSGVSVAVAHPSVVIGAGDYTGRVNAWIRATQSGPVHCADQGILPMVHVADLADALVTLVEGRQEGAYNLSIPGIRTLAEWVEVLKTYLPWPVEVHTDGDPMPLQVEERVDMDVRRAIQELGFAPRSLLACCRDLAGWLPEAP